MDEIKNHDEEVRLKNRNEEMSTMVFRPVKIQFYPEDLAKMETMEHDEKMDYVSWLRKENRYIEIDD